MNRKRQKFIEEISVQLLEKTGCFSYPVDIKKVAELSGVQVIYHDFGEDISGVLIVEGDTATIGVNSEQKFEPRQRFTIAHELGHYILGHQREGVFIDTPTQYFTVLYRDSKSSTGEFLQEREANAFAASILMPHQLVVDFVNEYSFDFKNDNVVDILSTKFNISTQATAFRLANLGYSY